MDRIITAYEPVVARTRRAMASFWHDRTVSKATLHALILLDSHGQMSMSRLAGLLDVALPNVTGIVTRMEEHGLVERVRDEHDRRVVLVRPTEKGRASAQEFEAIRRGQLRELVLALRPTDRRVCLRAFQALREAAERLDREEPADVRGQTPDHEAEEH